MSDRETLFEALAALRDAEVRGDATLGWAWQVVMQFVDTRLRRPQTEHEDVRQRTVIKVFKGVGRMQADVPAAAEAWLRRVHRSAVAEHHRRSDPAEDGLDRGSRDGSSTPLIDRLAAPEAGRTEEEQAALDAALSRVLERVEEWIDDNVPRPSKRLGDRQRAQAALLANVVGLGAAEIRERLGLEGSQATVYKWVERGREQVILPALAAWEAEGDTDPEGARLARAFREVLEGARRSDAGKPRPGRRTVSRGSRWTSIQSKPRGRGRDSGSER